MAQDTYSFDKLRSYVDEESGNTILVYKLTDFSSGYSCVVEGIHEHKIKRKGLKKIQSLIREEKRKIRNN